MLPDARRVDVVIEAPEPAVHTLDPAPGGYFAAIIPRATPFARYRYRLDGEGPYPDPCARFQPEGPHGPSRVVDANDFVWNDREWAGIGLKGQVIHEMHIGTCTRDAAYHQGTVWPWLIGHFVDAWLRVNADARAARALLDAFPGHLREVGIGSISEICDAEPPYRPRGCIAQAWSVAEVLRAWRATSQQTRTATSMY